MLGGALALFRYLPALDDARSLRADLEQMVTRAKTAGLGIDRPELVALRQDEAAARAKFSRLDEMLAGDPLIALARALPPTHDAIAGADAVGTAGAALLDAADAGLALADRYVGIKEQQAAAAADGGQGSALAQLVELMATGRDDVDRILAAVDRADAALATTPKDLPGPIAQIRDLMRQRLADYEPALRTYAQLDNTLPGILGWDGPRRYLVLTQNPAELRPTGGFIGSFGLITFDKGRITERTFQDVFLLDLPWDYPFIAAPDPLTRYLLGTEAAVAAGGRELVAGLPDQRAGRHPPVPQRGRHRPDRRRAGHHHLHHRRAARGHRPRHRARLRRHHRERRDHAQGAPEHPRRDATPQTNRKAFLSAFADRLFTALLALPPSRWTDLAGRGDAFQSEHLLLAWFADQGDEAEIAKLGFDGAIRQDPGDFIYPVDSNVSPVSKLNAVTDRSLDLDVRLDAYGNADNTLTVGWTNRDRDRPAASPIGSCRTLEDS